MRSHSDGIVARWACPIPSGHSGLRFGTRATRHVRSRPHRPRFHQRHSPADGATTPNERRCTRDQEMPRHGCAAQCCPPSRTSRHRSFPCRQRDQIATLHGCTRPDSNAVRSSLPVSPSSTWFWRALISQRREKRPRSALRAIFARPQPNPAAALPASRAGRLRDTNRFRQLPGRPLVRRTCRLYA